MVTCCKLFPVLPLALPLRWILDPLCGSLVLHPASSPLALARRPRMNPVNSSSLLLSGPTSGPATAPSSPHHGLILWDGAWWWKQRVRWGQLWLLRERLPLSETWQENIRKTVYIWLWKVSNIASLQAPRGKRRAYSKTEAERLL